jgi:5-hydroxyisourate hydrolase
VTAGQPARVTISTHVLDASVGAPARGVRVQLEHRGRDGAWLAAARGSTDGDGRLRFAVQANPADADAGEWRLTFGTGEYFGARGTESFYPEVTVAFTASAGHYHVPLLLSPFAYSTYRGS